MTLVKFRKSPFESLLTNDLLDFNPSNLLNDRLFLKRMDEPALNIIEKKDALKLN